MTHYFMGGEGRRIVLEGLEERKAVGGGGFATEGLLGLWLCSDSHRRARFAPTLPSVQTHRADDGLLSSALTPGDQVSNSSGGVWTPQ